MADDKDKAKRVDLKKFYNCVLPNGRNNYVVWSYTVRNYLMAAMLDQYLLTNEGNADHAQETVFLANQVSPALSIATVLERSGHTLRMLMRRKHRT